MFGECQQSLLISKTVYKSISPRGFWCPLFSENDQGMNILAYKHNDSTLTVIWLELKNQHCLRKKQQRHTPKTEFVMSACLKSRVRAVKVMSTLHKTNAMFNIHVEKTATAYSKNWACNVGMFEIRGISSESYVNITHKTNTMFNIHVCCLAIVSSTLWDGLWRSFIMCTLIQSE